MASSVAATNILFVVIKLSTEIFILERQTFLDFWNHQTFILMILPLKQSMKTVFHDKGYYTNPTSDMGRTDSLLSNENVVQRKNFISPPADIEAHCKVTRKDAIVDEES